MAQVAGGFRPETAAAFDAVVAVLEMIRTGVGANRVTSKGGRDLVTAMDVAVEETIRGVLDDATGFAVVGEERGGEASTEGSPCWLLDPICGTRNFASGIPLYCVNVALVEAGRVTVGVVGEPSGQIDVAELGRGAWAVAGEARHRLAVSEAGQSIVVEDGKATGSRREHAARFTADAMRLDRWDFRSFGSTLSLPYVAAGRIAAYVCFLASSLHAAAGTLLSSEAGAVVSGVLGDDWTVESDSVIVGASPALHRELVELSRSAWPGTRSAPDAG